MANVDKVIKDLVINEMSQEEFDTQKAAGTIAPNEIYVTPDKTDDKLDKKVSVIQGEENAGKILIVNEDGEVVPDKPKVGASLPILTHVFADHKLNDISWLNADTFSWQSGDVYIAAYEHLASEYEAETTLGGQTDTIDGITIYYRLAEDGHKIVPANHEADVQALYEKTGVAWYYILDKENKQFKLPRTKFGFTGLRDSVGKYVEAGLPNITGSFGNTISQSDSASSTQGAFALGTNWDNKVDGSSGNLKGQQYTFNASRSSSVYGKSTTVQSPATQMYLYFYVGNFERDAVEQTAGITSEQLNNKADIDLFNAIYPVGSIYIGTQSVCPMAIAIPNSTWELLEAGRALWTGNGSNGNTKIAAGLPNISGETSVADGYPNAIQYIRAVSASGAFYLSNRTMNCSKGAASANNSTASPIMFNASRSSSIYGNSTTVQPPAYVVNVWRRTA